MKIKVLFFASSREIVGHSEKSYEFTESVTLLTLRNRLQEDFPKLQFERDHIRLAVNKKYINNNELDHIMLTNGDEVALIPPIAGG
jgi:molybdopterin converting factor subunit 1